MGIKWSVSYNHKKVRRGKRLHKEMKKFVDVINKRGSSWINVVSIQTIQ